MGLLDAPPAKVPGFGALRRAANLALPPLTAAERPAIAQTIKNPATIIAGGIVSHLSTYLSQLGGSGGIRSYGGDVQRAAPSGGDNFYITSKHTAPGTAVYGAAPVYYDWVTDSGVFALDCKGNGGRARFWLDGRIASDIFQVGNDGGDYYLVCCSPGFGLGDTTSGSPTVANVQSKFVQGQGITGAGIPAGTTIASISADGATITLSANATATAARDVLAVTNGVGDTTNASQVLTNVTGTWAQGDKITGTGIPAGASVLGVNVRGPGTLLLSVNATANAAGVALTKAGSHRWMLESAGLYIGNVIRRFSADVFGSANTDLGKRVIVYGDSVPEGYSGGSTGFESYVIQGLRKLGYEDIWLSCQGGTGYLNPGPGGTGKVKFRDRMTTDFTPYAATFDVVILAYGHNDSDTGLYPLATLATELATIMARIRSEAPQAQLIVCSPYWENGFPTDGTVDANNVVGVSNTIKAAADAAGAQWVYVLDWITGKQSPAQGNAPYYVSTDTVHPSWPHGQEFLGRRFADAVQKVIKAL